LSNFDLVSSNRSGANFAIFWTHLMESKKFITDRLVVPCTA
jgi:hypothetical protein